MPRKIKTAEELEQEAAESRRILQEVVDSHYASEASKLQCPARPGEEQILYLNEIEEGVELFFKVGKIDLSLENKFRTFEALTARYKTTLALCKWAEREEKLNSGGRKQNGR